MTEASANTCLRHPDVETRLGCGKCGDPICPRCLVHTSVGARCPNCAQVKKSVVYQVSGALLYRSIAAAAVVGVVGGVILGILAGGGLARGLFLVVALFAAMGYGIGEAASQAANKRRGRELQIIVSAGIIAGTVVAYLFSGYVTVWWILGIAAAFVVGLARVR